MNRINSSLARIQTASLRFQSLTKKSTYNYRPFQDILDRQILGNVHKFNQDICLNQYQLQYLSHQIYHIHSSQSLVFLFRLLKLFSLTPDQFNVLNQAQRNKYQDFHQLRQIADKANYQRQLLLKKNKETNEKDSEEKYNDREESEESNDKPKERNINKVEFEQDNSILKELSNIYKMRGELKEVIWTIVNLHNNHIENAFLYHIFINKQLNKLISLAFDRDNETDFHVFTEVYHAVDRSLVTAEQMCLLLIILSTNEQYSNMPNIFEGELEGILSVIKDKEMNYSLGKFIIKLGLNHREEEQLSSFESLNFDIVQDSRIHLDEQSLHLYLYDLRNKHKGVDIQLFQKFNIENIVKKLRLDQIDELISTLIEYDQDEQQIHKEYVNGIIKQIIDDCLLQTENFKIFNKVLLDQLSLVTKYTEYVDEKEVKHLLDEIVSKIMNKTQGKTSLTNAFTEYIVDLIRISPPELLHTYPLYDAFFTKQSINSISYQQLIAIYSSMALSGVDYEEYLHVCYAIFSTNKHAIIQNQLHLTIIPLAQQLHDAQTAGLFGATVQAKKQIPEGIEFLSDFSESEDEADQKKQNENQEK